MIVSVSGVEAVRLISAVSIAATYDHYNQCLQNILVRRRGTRVEFVATSGTWLARGAVHGLEDFDGDVSASFVAADLRRAIEFLARVDREVDGCLYHDTSEILFDLEAGKLTHTASGRSATLAKSEAKFPDYVKAINEATRARQSNPKLGRTLVDAFLLESALDVFRVSHGGHLDRAGLRIEFGGPNDSIRLTHSRIEAVEVIVMPLRDPATPAETTDTPPPVEATA